MTSPASPRPAEPVRAPSIGGGRLVVAAVAVAIVVLILNAAVLYAALDRVDVAIFGVQLLVVALILLAALLHIRRLTHDRRRYALAAVLADLAAEPAGIQATARDALAALTASGVAEAGLIAIADDDAEEMTPIAARGYPPNWLATAVPRALPAATAAIEVTRGDADHPWATPLHASLEGRPWIARIPLRSGGDPIGLLLLAARRKGPLEDELLLERLGAQLATALDHAAIYEASYAREQDLELLDQRRRDFIAALAHELRTPLTSIQSFAELLQLQPVALDETAQQLVQSLDQGVQRLKLLVNDLLDLGQSEAAGFAIAPTAVDLAPLVADMEALLRPAYLLREQTLQVDLAEDARAVVADRPRLEQVLLNLLSNANRYTPARGVIHVRSIADDGHVRIEVEDAGEGIPEDLRERIFDPYYRVDRDEATVHGSGLGLAVARQLIELQGGAIWVDEAAGGGARFCIRLPAARSAPLPPAAPEAEATPPPEVEGATPPAKTEEATIPPAEPEAAEPPPQPVQETIEVGDQPDA